MRRRFPTCVSSSRSRRGVALLEVLIALVILGIGMIGSTMLQTNGVRQSAAGGTRDRAVVIAKDMANRMRINPGAFPAAGGVFAYDGHDSGKLSCAAHAGPVCEATATEDAAACSSAEMAAFDLHALSCGRESQSAESLPAGRLRIDCDDTPCTPDSVWRVVLEWSEPGLRADPGKNESIRQVTMRLRP